MRGGLPKPVSFMEEVRILEIVDRLADFRGTDRSSIYREAIRAFIRNLPEQEKKALEITEPAAKSFGIKLPDLSTGRVEANKRP